MFDNFLNNMRSLLDNYNCDYLCKVCNERIGKDGVVILVNRSLDDMINEKKSEIICYCKKCEKERNEK